jgi:hypothetical protein
MSVMIAGVPAEFRTENLPDNSLDRYCYANPLAESIFDDKVKSLS